MRENGHFFVAIWNENDETNISVQKHFTILFKWWKLNGLLRCSHFFCFFLWLLIEFETKDVCISHFAFGYTSVLFLCVCVCVSACTHTIFVVSFCFVYSSYSFVFFWTILNALAEHLQCDLTQCWCALDLSLSLFDSARLRAVLWCIHTNRYIHTYANSVNLPIHIIYSV